MAVPALLGKAVVVVVTPTPLEDPIELGRMLSMRMRWPEGEMIPFSCASCHNLGNGEIVFIGIKGPDVIVLKDDVNLFPSDNLVAQLRLITG